MALIRSFGPIVMNQMPPEVQEIGSDDNRTGTRYLNQRCQGKLYACVTLEMRPHTKATHVTI